MKTTNSLIVSLLILILFTNSSIFAQATEATNAITSGSYLGTSNDNDVVFKRQAVTVGLISTNSTSFGLNSLAYANSISIGTSAGYSSTSAYGGNTFIGNGSGSHSSGYFNSYFGGGAGYQQFGNLNISIGGSAGYGSPGSSNIFIGTQAGENTSGSGNIYMGFLAGAGATGQTVNDKLWISSPSFEDNGALIWGDFQQTQLKFNGKVGIGYGFGNYPTTAGGVNVSGYNLFVNGGILTEEVRVNLRGTNGQWADYVFNKDYNLKSLQEVEKFIKDNGHLPNVPSAQQVKEDGIELGEMAKIQQEKIEELTLYIIEQNKINEKQFKEIEELKNLVNQLISKER